MTRIDIETAIHQALQAEMARDPRVLLLGEGVATKRRALVEQFGAARVRNTPLAEAIVAGTAVGAAASGLRPVVDLLFAPFLAYAMDAIVNSAGKLRFLSGGQFEFPMVVMSMTGAGWGVGSQHNHNLEAMFVHAPGLRVVMPATPEDFRGLLISSIRDDNPVLFFTDLSLLPAEGEVAADADAIPLGSAAIRRSGTDVTLVGYAKTVTVCLAAAETLRAQHVSAEVVDLRTLKPLDEAAILRSLRKTGRLVVVTEASGLCGVAAEISAIAATRGFASLRAPVVRLTGPDAPIGASWALEQASVPTAEAVTRAALGLVHGSGREEAAGRRAANGWR